MGGVGEVVGAGMVFVVRGSVVSVAFSETNVLVVDVGGGGDVEEVLVVVLLVVLAVVAEVWVDDDLVEVDGGASDTREPGRLYALAHCSKVILSGQHQVAPLSSDVQK